MKGMYTLFVDERHEESKVLDRTTDIGFKEKHSKSYIKLNSYIWTSETLLFNPKCPEMKILIVEDEEKLRNSLKRGLKSKAFVDVAQMD